MINSCICGSSDYVEVDVPACKVQSSGSRRPAAGVVFGQCDDCGIIRQVSAPFSDREEFIDFYQNQYPPNKSNYSAKNYSHDLDLARKRADEYGITSGKRILDIGSGSGAFVDECRARSNDAFGCEIGKYSYEKNGQYIYRQPFEDIHFPTDYFDFVTSHDVLEHSLDPVGMLEEAFRVTKQEGIYIVDFPQFFSQAGAHHWKDAEHTWIFSEKQLKALLKKVGFIVTKITHPIKSKIVFYCEKPKQNRPTILVPPGIGDAYWTIVKLPAFLKREGLGMPDIHAMALVDKKFGTHLRAFPFIEMFPFLNAAWETTYFDKGDRTWVEAYARLGRTVFKNISGRDYLISYNGVLEAGYSLADIDPDLECNWYPPRFISLEEEAFLKECQEKYKKYAVFYFSPHGHYSVWAEEFPLSNIAKAVKGVVAKTGYTPVFAGAEWDLKCDNLQSIIKEVPGAVSLLGETSVGQLFGMLRGAEFVMGYPCGLTMSAAALHCKTLMFWCDWNRNGFWHNSSPPDTYNKTYFIESVRRLTPERLIEATVELAEDFPDPKIAGLEGERLYAQDREQAVVRFDRFKIKKGDRVLDVNSGSGAFVDECRERGVEAFGCEDTKYNYGTDGPYIYKQPLQDIHFPMDHFDKVVVIDTFGYLMDQRGFFTELLRITKQQGKCFLIFGFKKHHVDQHGFDVAGLEVALKQAGFKIQSIETDGGKTLFNMVKPKQKRVKIMLPPGIGDAYWSLVKMQAFLRKHRLGVPDTYIVYPRQRKSKAHERAVPFLEMFPWLNSTGKVVTINPGKDKEIWRDAYHADSGKSIFKDVLGCDYFICYNSILRYGNSLEDVDKDLECNWAPPAFVSLDQINFQRESKEKYGKYFVVYYAYRGTNKELLKDFSVSDMVKYISTIAKKTGLVPIYVGASWDDQDHNLTTMIEDTPGAVNLVGETDLQQLFGLMKGAEAVVGIPSGITIMSAVMGLKTVMIWNDWFNRDFSWYSCPPEVKEKTYVALRSSEVTLSGLTARTLALIKDAPFYQRASHIRKPAYKIVAPRAAKKIKKIIPEPTYYPSTVICVLKSGGVYDERYVIKLKNALDRNTVRPYRFVCLTDKSHIPDIETIPLIEDLPGWWSKIELFRPGLLNTERVLYFDLDTLILENVDDMLLVSGGFHALQPWNRKNRRNGGCASGIMAWDNGAFDFIYNDFEKKDMKLPGDQDYINAVLKKYRIKFKPLQRIIPGIHSYKRECRGEKRPNNNRVVCFHGRPRIPDVIEPWVVEAWK